jgi:hypothetical protein
VIHALRQGFPTRMQAERMFDELMNKMKGILIEKHYDSVTGRRKPTFAWDQSIVMPFNDFRDKH